jgi:methionyl-tRNA synthetase
MDRKASSSGEVPPPMAIDLLEYYTVDQLRAHFIALGLNKRAVSFKPRPLDPHAEPTAPDPVLKESALLTNIFNRLARSCFYEAQKSFGGRLPLSSVPAPLVADATQTMLDFERALYATELHTAFDLASEFIRRANRYWSDAIREAGDNLEARREVLASAFYLLRIALVLMHPVVPGGTERIFKQMSFDVSVEDYFSWEHMPEGNEAFFSPADLANGGHPLQELPPRFDFFEKHPSQF